ncbi:uncharacterized protein LOC116851387 [Odontomachus brunneus]|uniref:uncharacterized protein LOC116851387 n=1 Tax=Odontomachus brunneus TaxID=486640 RepID=UPI0013F1D363|nr:uncharacterized protein LOC116851387 [Odontomachus brunneus]
METKKRESWETEETRYFLKLIKERQVMKTLDGKRFRADDIFKHLELPMNEKGYNKTSKQMQTRFRTVRLQYNKIRRQMGKSGAGNCMSLFPYAEEMGQLLDFRPIAIGDVVDSTPLQDLSKNNDYSYSSNSIYEDEPDPRDGAVLGCSSTSNNNCTTEYRSEDSPSDTNTVNLSTVNSSIPAKKRKVSRSNEAVTLRYADKLKENYEEVQSKIMTENRCFIQSLMESEKQLEKEIINNMLESQRSILKETTNQLLTGLQNIFASIVPTQHSTVSVPTVNPIVQSPFVMSPVHYSSPFSPPNLNSETFHPSSPFPKILLNLKQLASKTAKNVQQTISIEKHPQAENKDPIPIQSLLNVTSQDSQNLN